MKLTKKEQAWLDRLRKTLDAKPMSLMGKIGAYTIGDNDITLYDLKAFDEYYSEGEPCRDKCELVGESDTALESISFPFCIESTAG